MPKQKETLTEEEQLEADLLVEDELKLLQRRYRLLDAEHTKCTTKAGMQYHVIKNLNMEMSNVMNDCSVATSNIKKRLDSKIYLEMRGLLDENDLIDTQTNRMRKHLVELDIEINKIKKDVDKKQRMQITDLQFQQRILVGGKTVEGLENKLETEVKKFCTILTENHHMRDEISHLFIERKSFNKLWNKLIGNLNLGKHFLMDLIQQAVVAYNQRDEWCSKLQTLREIAYVDLINQRQEMQDLQRSLSNNKKVKDFLKIKAQRREMLMLEAKQREEKEKSRAQLKQLLERQQYAMKQIFKFSGIDNITALMHTYIKKEEKNFSEFNYFNDMYHETENISDNLVDLYEKIDVLREQSDIRNAHETKMLVKLRNDLKRVKKEADMRQDELKKKLANLQKLYRGIEKLLNICKCNRESLINMLGDNTNVNNYNVLLYLAILETKIDELIVASYYKQKTSSKDKAAIPLIDVNLLSNPRDLITAIVPTNPCPLCIEQEQVSDIIDELQFVQNEHELVQSLFKRLSLPGGLDCLHNVSACHLPKSRLIIQRRYQ